MFKHGNLDPLLSEGIGQLVNLQLLDMEKCENLTMLPKGLSKLINLQLLRVTHAMRLPDLSHLQPALNIEKRG